jgi:hypothetical protein
MPRLVPIEKKLLKRLYPHLRGDVAGIDRQAFIDMIMEADRMGPAFAGVVGRKVLGVGGIIIHPDNPSRGEVWMCLSHEIKKHGKWLNKIVPKIRDTIATKHGLREIHGDVMEDFDVARRWAKKMGFEEQDLFNADLTGKSHVNVVYKVED